MADKVVTHENEAGDKTIGLDSEGAFIPFATVSAGKIEQLRERHANLTERAEAGDELAIAALGSAFKQPAKGKAKAGEGDDAAGDDDEGAK